MRFRPRFTFRRTLLAAAAVAAGVLVTTSASTASHPFVAGESSTVELPLGAAERAAAAANAARVAAALGLTDGTPTVKRIDDRFDGETYDEVTLRDVGDRPVAVVRLGVDGRLVSAVALGLHDSTTLVSTEEAEQRARRFVGSAGFAPSGSPRTRPAQGAGGWLVTWPRVVADAPVRGDGVRVALWADGALHSLSRTEHRLAPVPPAVASDTEARIAADAFVGRRFAGASSLAFARLTRAWVFPNDTWDAALPDAPAATGRLAWVAEYRATGRLAERLVAIEVWVDAGTLAVIGGDVAE